MDEDLLKQKETEIRKELDVSANNYVQEQINGLTKSQAILLGLQTHTGENGPNLAGYYMYLTNQWLLNQIVSTRLDVLQRNQKPFIGGEN